MCVSTDLASLTQSELYQLNQNLLEEAAQKRPLMSEIQPLSVLRTEYEGAHGFVSKIDWLCARGWLGLRCVVSDGSVLSLTCTLGGHWVTAIVSTDKPPLSVWAHRHLSTDQYVYSVLVHRTYTAIARSRPGRGICTYGHRRNTDNSPSGRVRSHGGEWAVGSSM